MPITALYAIMFSRTGHLTLGQIGLLFAVWSLAYVVCELPLGVLADFWSRRKTMLLGGLLRAAAFTVWLAAPNFAGYMVGFVLWGVMIAASSGSVQAYLQHELQADKLEHKFSRYFGWIMSAYSCGALAGYAVAALLTLHHARELLILSIVSSLVFAGALAMAHERPYPRQTSYLATLRAALAQVAHSRRLQYVCFGLFSIYMTVGVLEELLSRVYAGFGLNDTWVSVLGGAALVASVLLLTRLERLVQFSLAKQCLVLVAALALFVGGLWWASHAASVLILGFYLVFYLFRPVFSHHVQEAATGNERATINSIPGLFGGALGAVAYGVIGKVAEARSERFALGAYAVVWLAVFAVLAVVGRRFTVPAGKPVLPVADAMPHTVPE